MPDDHDDRQAHLSRLIAALSDPSAYPHAVEEVEVKQTHISVVFLAGSFAYKLKKPVTLAFLDYGTLDLRLHFCEEEVRINRRLAPGVYLEVLPVVEGADGRLTVGTDHLSPVVEWVVQMERLPPEATFQALLDRGALTEDHILRLARRIADFHATAASGPRVSAFARFEVVSQNAMDNFLREDGTREDPHRRGELPERLAYWTEVRLARLRDRIESRADRQLARETHGDLRLEHVYDRPELPPPRDLIVVDGIEFAERFRHADPAADVAFPLMDLIAAGRRDLAKLLADSYIAASGDDEARELLPFYTGYRASVRAKVDRLKAAEPEVPPRDRGDAILQARAHTLLALGELADPIERPGLILVGGLPGSGKSSLVSKLAPLAGLEVFQSDRTRKLIAASRGVEAGPSARFEEGLYTSEWTDRTYDVIRGRAIDVAGRGGRAAVDASFRREVHRHALLDEARRCCVRALFLICRTDPDTTRLRLERRRLQGDPAGSEADWSVYLRAAESWEEPGPETAAQTVTIDTSGDLETSIEQALDALEKAGLFAR